MPGKPKHSVVNTLFIIVSLLFATSVARADAKTLDDFVQRYTAGARAIHTRFLFAAYEAQRTQCDRQGAFSIEDTLNVLTRGDKFRLISYCTRSAKSDLPAGSVWVCGGDGGQYFSALKSAGRREFVFSAFGKDAYAVAKLRNQCLTAVAPFTIATTTIAELLSGSKLVPVDAQRCTSDGRAAIKITFKPHDSTMTTKAMSITVLTDSLYLSEYEVTFAHFALHGENRYTGGGQMPDLKQVETWSQASDSIVRKSDQKITITSFKPTTIPAEEFTPLAAGIKEVPAPISPPRD